MDNEKTAITGKRGEYEVIGKLMQEGFIVYTPVLDCDGVDCVIKNEKGRLIEIQIKTRNKGEGYNKQFIIKRELNCSLDFFICCYLIDTKEIWFIPSFTFKKLSEPNENGWNVLTMNFENEKELLGYKGERGFRIIKDIYEQKKE
jgi:hypothetical protein